MKEQINPAVIETLMPIIQNTTALYNKQLLFESQHTQPMYTNERPKESDDEKLAKKQCVHMAFDTNGMLKYLPEESDRDGYRKCPFCKRYIPVKFDEKHVQSVLEAIDTINQLVFFGGMLNLDASALTTLVALKVVLPDVAQLAHELNTYVTLDQSANEGMNGIAKNYKRNSATVWN